MENSFNIIDFLRGAVAKGASDIHLRVGEKPALRKDGSIVKVNVPVLTEDDMEDVVSQIVPIGLKDKIGHINDLDFSYEIEGLSRFRVNLCRQMSKLALVIRAIPYNIATLKELKLPPSLEDFAKLNNGIVLVTGPTGSGKTSTIASLIEYINNNFQKHIITVEDPIEFIYTNKRSIVTQRQIKVDVATFHEGIKYSLRQDPDVILIGEIRDRETITNALKAAETGHLVFATLHTTDAIQTLNRIINMFEPHERPFIKTQLAETLRGTIAQKLVKKIDGDGRVPALEVLVVTPTIKDFIIKDKFDDIYDLLRSGQFNDMMTMNMSLYGLTKINYISKEQALEASDNKNELELMFRGAFHGTYTQH